MVDGFPGLSIITVPGVVMDVLARVVCICKTETLGPEEFHKPSAIVIGLAVQEHITRYRRERWIQDVRCNGGICICKDEDYIMGWGGLDEAL